VFEYPLVKSLVSGLFSASLEQRSDD